MPPAASIAQILQGLRVIELKEYITAGGLPASDARTKAPLINILLDNPAAIPAALRERAVPRIFFPDEIEEQQRLERERLEREQPRRNVPPDNQLIETIANTVEQVVLSKIAEVMARLGALEARGEPSTTTITPAAAAATATAGPHSDPSSFAPPTTVPAPASTRIFFAWVQQDVYDAVVHNSFDIKDLWKLDPVRQGEMMGMRSGSTNDPLAALASALNSTEDTRRQQAHGKYTNLGSILRPWLVYTQLRSLLTPGIGVYLTGYARELCRIDYQYPNRFSSLLEYHFLFVQVRLNAGLTLNPMQWTQHNEQLFHQTFSPGSMYVSAETTTATTATAAAKSKGSSSGNASTSPAWNLQSVGTGTRPQACSKWNNAKSCATWPCPYRHICSGCEATGHTVKRCGRAGNLGWLEHGLRALAPTPWVMFLMPSFIELFSQLLPLRIPSQPSADLPPVASTSSSLSGAAPPVIVITPPDNDTSGASPTTNDAASSGHSDASSLSGAAPLFSGPPLPQARPNTRPADGFVPHGSTPVALGGGVQKAVFCWARELEGYPDSSFLHLFMSIVENGATLGTSNVNPPPKIYVKPYRSGPRELDFLRTEVKRRLDAGEIRIVDKDFPTCITPLAAVPKEVTKLRAIHDLRELNEYVPNLFGTLEYASLDAFLDLLASMPEGVSIWKGDLANAFRNVRLAPDAARLAGFELDGVTYIDLCLPFGSRVAPVIFNYVAEALHWVLEKRGMRHGAHYLDDFFGCGLSWDEAKSALDLFRSTCSYRRNKAAWAVCSRVSPNGVGARRRLDESSTRRG